MARRAARPMPEPKGSLLIWLAGLVFGVGAGIVLVYHLLLASQAGDVPLEVSAAVAQPNPTSLDSAHAEALRAAREASAARK